MVAPSATIELYVDGTRVPSTPAELDAGLVTVLDRLRLTWGRDGQNEQPGPASVVFELVDPAGGGDALDVAHVGSTVAVWAEGQIPGTGTGFTETYDDPTLNTFPLGDAVASRYAGQAVQSSAIVTDVDGARVIVLRGTSSSDTWAPYAHVTVPPRRFSAAGETPDAWDSIPRWSNVGPNWQASLRVKAPAGSRLTIGLKFFAAPYEGSQSAGGSTASNTPMTGQWQTVTGTVPKFAASLNGKWMAVAAEVSGLIPRWKDQPPALTWSGMVGTWGEFGAILIDTTSVQRPAGAATVRRVLVFSGEVSDLELAPWGDRVSTVQTVTAVDLGGALGNTVVGDNPWPVQTVAVRADRVAQLAGITTSPRIRIDTPLGALQLSARDVDAQPAYSLLQDAAQSAGGVLWAATHAVTGPYLWIENPANRAALRELVESGGIVTIAGAARGVSVLSACDLLEDPVRWRQDTGDVVTVVAITWMEQGVDGDGQPTATERTVTVKDQAAIDGTGGKPKLGTRRLSISTELVAEADATAYANRVLAQARAVGWRLDGLVLDTAAHLKDTLDSVDDAARVTTLLDLLDGTTRMGAAVTLVDMPHYAPRGAISDTYVDGGTYTYTRDGWRLELGATPSPGVGVSARWSQLDPGWSWNEFAPSIQWVDLYGVAA